MRLNCAISVCFLLLLLLTCEMAEDINLITFFDCFNSTTAEKMEKCDFLAQLGAEVARDTINADPSRKNVTFYPVEIQSSISTEVFLEAIRGTIQVLEQLNGSRLHGFVGPQNFVAVEQLVPLISRFSNLTSVSYSVTTQSADNYFKFYRTLPSDMFVNVGRLILVHLFKWFRIGILHSTEEEHFSASNQFLDLFNHFLEDYFGEDHGVSFSRSLRFADEVDMRNNLERYRDDDMRIFFGFFGPEDARSVLCEAWKLNLTDETHAWVLPAYANPNWWRRPSLGGLSATSCSDKEMTDALESVIFVDAVKFPPFDTNMSDFIPKLHQKASKLFPSLSHEDFMSFFLNSRAISAHDAVMMLVSSAHPYLLENISLPSSQDPFNPFPLNPCLLDCEWCRMYWPDFTGEEDCSNCSREEIAAFCSYSSVNPEDQALSRQYYGQTLYTQFKGGQHCPVALYWIAEAERWEINFRDISHFTNCSTCNMSTNQLLDDIALLLTNFTNCSQTFTWRGGDAPPISIRVKHSFINTALVVLAILLAFISLLITVAFCLLNILWRKNRFVKATSPRLNIVMLTGYALIVPIVIFHGVVYSANHIWSCDLLYTSLCQLSLWSYCLGFLLVFATILVKSWRLYSIFSENIQVKMGKLSDNHLFIGIALLSLPVAAILCISTGVEKSRLKFTGTPQPLNTSLEGNLLSYDVINITTCQAQSPEYQLLFSLLLFLYFAIMIVTSLFILLLLNRRVPPSRFRDDSLHSLRALLLSIIPLLMIVPGGVGTQQLYQVFWGLEVVAILFNLITEIVIYFPVVYQVYCHWRDQQKLKSREKHETQLRFRLKSASEEVEVLREELKKKERKISHLKERQYSVNSVKL